MGRRIKYDEFIKSDIDYIVSNANFTDAQMEIFLELCKGSLYDDGKMTEAGRAAWEEIK